jgi:hypothetical protein
MVAKCTPFNKFYFVQFFLFFSISFVFKYILDKMSDNNQSNGMILDVSNAYENEYDRMESTVNTNGDVEKSDYPNENAFAKDDDSKSSIEEDLNLDETPLTPTDKATIPAMVSFYLGEG